jgi:hypothetical protein
MNYTTAESARLPLARDEEFSAERLSNKGWLLALAVIAEVINLM